MGSPYSLLIVTSFTGPSSSDAGTKKDQNLPVGKTLVLTTGAAKIFGCWDHERGGKVTVIVNRFNFFQNKGDPHLEFCR
jgi:hypothetical protein